MNVLLRARATRGRRKVKMRPDPQETISLFLRTLARLAPRASGGAQVAATALREKP
ncbi:MAG: hypothetical protein KGM42_10635 [Hyphomicrobiales bacterium]|nr:hypothetical protein [Hyphomicrobiales bacterium]